MRKPHRLVVVTVLLFMSGLVGFTSLLARRAQQQLSEAQGEVVELRLQVAERAEVIRRAEIEREIERLSNPATAIVDAPESEQAVGAALLRDWMRAHQEVAIPELRILPNSEWERLGLLVLTKSDSNYQTAARLLRRSARAILGEDIATALVKFAADNEGVLPLAVSQLEPYLPENVTDEMLGRYAMLHFGLLGDHPVNRPLVGEIDGVDDEFDTVLSVARDSLTQVTSDRAGSEVYRGLHRYLNGNGGEMPPSAEALLPYLDAQIPVQTNMISNYLSNSDLQNY